MERKDCNLLLNCTLIIYLINFGIKRSHILLFNRVNSELLRNSEVLSYFPFYYENYVLLFCLLQANVRSQKRVLSQNNSSNTVKRQSSENIENIMKRNK